MYLWRRSTGFCFQLRVPKKYQVYLGSTPLRLWLGPIDKRSASRMATVLAAKAFQNFGAGMDRKALDSSLKALHEEMESVSKKKRRASWKANSLRNELDMEFNLDDKEQIPLWRYNLDQYDLYRIEEANKFDGVADTYAASLEQLSRIQDALKLEQIEVEAEKVGFQNAFRTVVSMNAGTAVPQPQQNLPQAACLPPSITEEVDDEEITANTLLSSAAEVVLTARREAKGAGSVPDRYQERLETAVAAFIDVIGDLPLRKYLPIHMQQFATVMAEVPRNRSKYPEFKGLSLKQIVEKNRKRKSPLPCLGVTTIQGSVSEVLNLWGRATAGVDGAKDLKAYRITMPSAAAKSTVREGLPIANLNTWIAGAAEQKPREAHKRWLPLVGMLTGMRLGEIVWLQVSDLVEQSGHTIIDLRLPLVINRKEVERRLKTETSPRIVALPPALIKAGFVDYVRNVRKRGFVFSAFHTADDPADAASKQMKNWMVKLGIHERQRQTFHSLRHNAKHWYAYHFGERISDRQLGHAPSNIGGKYGFQVLQPEEIERISEMPTPRGLDLSPFIS
ncbi:tyrosine-type recombinase/integrase [Roseibium aggregatum]|nr:tyrosine-type recombinase/integrase [Roseibium aggregatum]